MITQGQLKSALVYDPTTGVFTWLINRPRARAGEVAGAVFTNGYRRIQVFGRSYAAHRLAFLYMEGVFPEDEVDHINRRRDDNRFENLRKVTRAMNMRNKGKYKNNTSGHTGVLKRGDRFRARIFVSGSWVSLGAYETEGSAIAAYRAAKSKIHAVSCSR